MAGTLKWKSSERGNKLVIMVSVCGGGRGEGGGQRNVLLDCHDSQLLTPRSQ